MKMVKKVLAALCCAILLLPVSTALIEAAHIDGAGEFRIFWHIVMPNVKPAWLTVIIFSVNGLWNNSASTVIYSEAKKTLVYALTQIQAGGIARTGQAMSRSGSPPSFRAFR